MSAKIVRCDLKLPLCLLKLTDSRTNVRMMLVPLSPFPFLSAEAEIRYCRRLLRCQRSRKTEGQQHCNCCANHSFHEAPPKECVAAIAYSRAHLLAYNRTFCCAFCRLPYITGEEHSCQRPRRLVPASRKIPSVQKRSRPTFITACKRRGP